MIKGLYETHLYVENLERSIDFYQNTLELELGYTEAHRRSAFFWIGGTRKFMLGIWEKPKSDIHRRHFAFECEPKWVLEESVSYLKKRHLTCSNFLNDGTERPMVFAWMPAVSIYFVDPDGHSLEFIGLLTGPSHPENGILTYEDWLLTDGAVAVE
jgi:lactoylglutathione lyase